MGGKHLSILPLCSTFFYPPSTVILSFQTPNYTYFALYQDYLNTIHCRFMEPTRNSQSQLYAFEMMSEIFFKVVRSPNQYCKVPRFISISKTASSRLLTLNSSPYIGVTPKDHVVWNIPTYWGLTELLGPPSTHISTCVRAQSCPTLLWPHGL